MLTFKPAIVREGVTYELPRPLTRLRIQESYDAQVYKVPLREGDVVAGQSRNGVDILIEGQIGKQGETLLLSEEQMLAELEALRAACEPGSPEGVCQLVIYQDVVTGEVRQYRDCSISRVETDLSNPWLFTYAVTLRGHDPRMGE